MRLIQGFFSLQAPIIIGKYFSLKKNKLLSEIGPNKVLFCPEIEDIVYVLDLNADFLGSLSIGKGNSVQNNLFC